MNRTAYDETRLMLYLNISQVFSLWMIPFHHANVTLTTELQLVRSSNKYYIQSQNDLYQNDQLIRFFMPFGLGEFVTHMYQYSSTMMCVLGSFLLAPATHIQQNFAEKREQNGSWNAEDEMRDLVSSAMEGVGYKKPSGSRRRPSNGGASGSGASASSSGNNGVQQYGKMQVIS